MKKYHIAVLCVDRTSVGGDSGARRAEWRPANYLKGSVDSLMRTAGLGLLPEDRWDVTLFDSGSASLDYLTPLTTRWPGIGVNAAPHRMGLLDNFRRALHSAAGKARYVCLMEDDVVFRPLAFPALDRWLDRLGNRDFACATLWPLPGDVVDGELVAAPGVFWGNYFVVFRSDRLRDMLDHPVCRGWHNRVTPDLMIGAWAKQGGGDVLVHTGDLVQHVGTYSTLGDRDERVSDAFDPSTPAIDPSDLIQDSTYAHAGTVEPWFSVLFPNSRVRLREGCGLALEGSRYFAERPGLRRRALNPAAALVLGLCESETSFAELVERVAALQPGTTSERELSNDISSVLLRFLGLRLIELCGFPGAVRK